MAYIGRNPDWNTSTFNPLSADPANPVEGMVFYSDGTSRNEGFWHYKNGAWVEGLAGDNPIVETLGVTPLSADPSTPTEGLIYYSDGTSRATGFWQYDGSIWKPLGSNTSGFFNYIVGGNGSDDSAWVQYANSSASDRPDDFGGTASTNFTIESNLSSSALDGTQDFLITKDAANRQGEGVYYPFTVRPGDVATILRLEAWAKTSANYADGDIGYYLVTSNDSFVSDFNILKIGDSGQLAYANARRLFLEGQTDATRTDARFCVHVQSTNASSYTLNAQYSFGPRSIARGPVVLDEKDLSISVNFIPGTIQEAKYQRIGEIMKGRVRFQASGAATGNIAFTLNEHTMKTVINRSVGLVVGFDGSLAHLGTVNQENAKDLRFFGDDGSGLWNATAPFTWSSGDLIDFSFSVPIEGWSSNAKISEDFGNRFIVAAGQNNAGTSLTANTTNIDWIETEDNTSSFNNTEFVAPQSGWVDVEGSVRFTTSVVANIKAYIDGVDANQNFGYNISAQIVPISGKIYLEKGQALSFRSGANATLLSNSEFHWINITYIQTPQTLAGSEVVGLFAKTNSGQSITNNLVQTIVFEDIEDSTHGNYNTSTGKFTVNQDGRYFVTSSITILGTTSWNGTTETFNLYVYKNNQLITRTIKYPVTPSIEEQTSVFAYVDAVAGDEIDIRVLQNSAATQSLIADAVLNYLIIYKIN